jgi:hypothetical protein
VFEVKYEDDISDSMQESFFEVHDWLTSKLTDQKNSTKSYIPDPYLGHAAGDYEPLNENSRFHQSAHPHRTTRNFNKVRGFSQKRLDELLAMNGRLVDTSTTFSAMDLD